MDGARIPPLDTDERRDGVAPSTASTRSIIAMEKNLENYMRERAAEEGTLPRRRGTQRSMVARTQHRLRSYGRVHSERRASL